MLNVTKSVGPPPNDPPMEYFLFCPKSLPGGALFKGVLFKGVLFFPEFSKFLENP